MGLESLLGRVFSEMYQTVPNIQEISGGEILELVSLRVSINGQNFQLEARRTDNIGRNGIFSVYEIGTSVDRYINADGDLVTRVDGNYRRSLIVKKPFATAKRALRAGEKALRRELKYLPK